MQPFFVEKSTFQIHFVVFYKSKVAFLSVLMKRSSGGQLRKTLPAGAAHFESFLTLSRRISLVGIMISFSEGRSPRIMSNSVFVARCPFSAMS